MATRRRNAAHYPASERWYNACSYNDQTNYNFALGIQYFVMIFLIGIANIVMIHVAPAGLTATLSILYMVAASTLGCRLILNLRGSVLRSTYNEEDTTTDLNTLVFNNHPNGTIAMHEYRRSVMRRMAQ